MHTYTELIKSQIQLDDYLKTINQELVTLRPNNILVQLFLTNDDFIAYDIYRSIIIDFFPNAKILGVISNDNIYRNGSVVHESIISITTFEKSTIWAFSYSFSEICQKKFGEFLIRNHCTKHSKSIFLYANINCLDCEDTLLSIKTLAPHIHISGGIIPYSGNEVVFNGSTVLEQGVVGFVIDSPNLIANNYTNYVASPIGKQHIITDATDKTIRKIDNINAKEFYFKYIGSFSNDIVGSIGYHFPLLIHNGDSYIPKGINTITDEGYLVMNSQIYPGDIVSVGFTNMKHLFEGMKSSFNAINTFPMETAFVFKGKQRHMATAANVSYNFGDSYIPMAGFLTDLEFINQEHRPNIGIGSFSFVTLSESDQSFFNLKEHVKVSINYKDEDLVLLNLIENTTSELNVINQNLEKVVREKTNALTKQYYRDYLTGLANENKLYKNIQLKHVNALALIDISSFVHINNFYGNQIGNRLLVELAELIKTFISSKSCKGYHIHSDIFAISSKVLSEEAFNDLIYDLQLYIHQHTFMDLSLDIALSTKVVISHSNVNIYDHCRMTLEYAKTKNIHYLIYDESLEIEATIQNNLIWTSKLQNAINNDRIVPYYQPIYNNALNTIDHYEVLVRLIDENGYVYTPIYFLEIAKKTNLYRSLTRIMIQKSFEKFNDTNYIFSVNLSSEDIVSDSTRSYIYNALAAYSNPSNIIFELVETESINNYDIIKSFIDTVKSYGASIAIDDFGTGFSNFHYLFKLNVSMIKIDGSIIQEILSENAANSVAETIVTFANKMNILVVAEYVSDESIFNKIRSMGIQYSQGYYVAKPSATILTEAFQLSVN